MLSFAGSLKVFLALEPVDMRKGFSGLMAIAAERLREDPRKGALLVFTNRRRSRLKILYFDGTGMWLLCKRLERGTFAWPDRATAPEGKLHLRAEALAMLTDGIDLRGATMRPWYGRDD
jgi:transposase